MDILAKMKIAEKLDRQGLYREADRIMLSQAQEVGVDPNLQVKSDWGLNRWAITNWLKRLIQAGNPQYLSAIEDAYNGDMTKIAPLFNEFQSSFGSKYPIEKIQPFFNNRQYADDILALVAQKRSQIEGDTKALQPQPPKPQAEIKPEGAPYSGYRANNNLVALPEDPNIIAKQPGGWNKRTIIPKGTVVRSYDDLVRFEYNGQVATWGPVRVVTAPGKLGPELWVDISGLSRLRK